MANMRIHPLLKQYPLVSDQVTVTEISCILEQLEEVVVAHVPGAVVEFGCYVGTTSLFIQRLLRRIDPPRPFHVYDSFSGLPNKQLVDHSPAGNQFTQGELQTSKAQFVKNFVRASVPLPIIHKKWFKDLRDSDVPSPIALAFLDGDFFESIATSLTLVRSGMVAGSRIIVDDYLSDSLPGVQPAVDRWCAVTKLPLQVVAGMALIKVRT